MSGVFALYVSINYILYFFFFRQKTAYELRISDWSSDVCSSDLERTRLALLRAIARRLRGRATHISLRPVPDENGSIDLLTRAFRSAGWAVFARAVDHNHFLDVGERDFDSYWDARPGALRSTVDRKMAKFPVDLEIDRKSTRL